MAVVWKHKKRGTIYEIITDAASLQCASCPEFEEQFDNDNWTVYRNLHTGAIYVRPAEEFHDGRFEQVEA